MKKSVWLQTVRREVERCSGTNIEYLYEAEFRAAEEKVREENCDL